MYIKLADQRYYSQHFGNFASKFPEKFWDDVEVFFFISILLWNLKSQQKKLKLMDMQLIKFFKIFAVLLKKQRKI